MKKHKSDDEELRHFRTEAAELLQVKDRSQSETKTGPC
jgi:hypothetical protein